VKHAKFVIGLISVLVFAFAGCGGDDNGNGDCTPQGGDITVLAPSCGETLKVGQAFSIKWDCIDTIVDVSILFSRDGGATFPPPKLAETIDTQSADWKSFSWTPTADDVCTDCIIRIEEYDNTSTYDLSDQAFKVEE
jgi:hypothetical protein